MTTGHITQYSRLLLEKLIAAHFFEEISRPLWRPEAEVYSLLGHDLVVIGNLLPTFRRNLLPPSSWSGSIPRQTNFYQRRHGISNHTSLMPQPVIRNACEWAPVNEFVCSNVYGSPNLSYFFVLFVTNNELEKKYVGLLHRIKWINLCSLLRLDDEASIDLHCEC